MNLLVPPNRGELLFIWREVHSLSLSVAADTEISGVSQICDFIFQILFIEV